MYLFTRSMTEVWPNWAQWTPMLATLFEKEKWSNLTPFYVHPWRTSFWTSWVLTWNGDPGGLPPLPPLSTELALLSALFLFNRTLWTSFSSRARSSSPALPLLSPLLSCDEGVLLEDSSSSFRAWTTMFRLDLSNRNMILSACPLTAYCIAEL